MELISSLKSVEMYDKIRLLVDGIVLGCKYSFYANNIFDENEMDLLIKETKKNKQRLFLLVNIVMHEELREDIEIYLKKYKEYNHIYFIYQDLGIYQILKNLGIVYRGIYNPLTMITNYQDLLMYDELDMDAIGISNEITLDDVNICSNHSNKVFYLGFGYHPMYQTYRHLAKLYKEYSALEFENNNLFIKELNKEEIMPLVDNEFGSLVFRSGVISILEQIEKIEKVKYLYLDGIFLEEDKQIKIINIYFDVLKKKNTKEEGMILLNKLNLQYSNKFMNEDSVYNPKDF